MLNLFLFTGQPELIVLQGCGSTERRQPYPNSECFTCMFIDKCI